ncbi:MAG: class I SAM-dependent methyltransferase [Planctomycetes bacterium]|nr:class I SAM-dependent methyltransferase [Planctomycetota bacterium]
MEYKRGAEPERAEVAAYESWRNKYATEPERCTTYETLRVAPPGRRFASWLDGRMVLRALEGIRPGSAVLDVPCGGGRISRTLRRAGFAPFAADFSPWMVRESRPDAAGWARADALRLPFRDRTFAAAVCFRFMQAVPLAIRLGVLRELGRVAVRVLANYQNVLSLRGTRRFLLGRSGLANRVSEAQAVAEAESAGLRVTRCCYKSRFFCEDFLVVAELPAGEIPQAGPPPSSALRDLLERH